MRSRLCLCFYQFRWQFKEKKRHCSCFILVLFCFYLNSYSSVHSMEQLRFAITLIQLDELKCFCLVFVFFFVFFVSGNNTVFSNSGWQQWYLPIRRKKFHSCSNYIICIWYLSRLTTVSIPNSVIVNSLWNALTKNSAFVLIIHWMVCVALHVHMHVKIFCSLTHTFHLFVIVKASSFHSQIEY